MLRKALSVMAVVAGAALSAVGIVTIVKHDDTTEKKETTTTKTETVKTESSDDE